MKKENLCKDILKDLKKQDVGVKVDENIKGNYYSYIHNCIYLNKSEFCDNNSIAKEAVIIAHECIHATQSKVLHLLNIIFANLELIMFALTIIIMLIVKNTTFIQLTYLCVCVVSLLFRCILEIPAMIFSFNLAIKYCKEDVKKIILKDKTKIKYMIPLGILSFSWFKILRLLTVITIKFI